MRSLCILALLAGGIGGAQAVPEFVPVPEGVVEVRDAPAGFALAVKVGSFLIGRTEINGNTAG